jgi:probable rRNA maturation factor
LFVPEGDSADEPHRPTPSGAGSASVWIDVASPKVAPAWTVWLTEQVTRALALLNVGGDVRIRLAGDDEVATAHQRFLGVEGTTDVITFDLSEPAEPDFDESQTQPRRLDVDLLVCVDEGLRQAAARGIPPQHELLLYCVHGVLHCLGHDDHDDEAYRAMHAAEDEILAAIGASVRFHAAVDKASDTAGGDA